jgi:hypothetical protein
MVQVPGVIIVASVPLTVQTLRVELANVTTDPEESEAEPRENVPVPPEVQVGELGGVQMIDCVAGITLIESGVEVRRGNDVDAVTPSVPMVVPVTTTEDVPLTAETPESPETAPVPETCA